MKVVLKAEPLETEEKAEARIVEKDARAVVLETERTVITTVETVLVHRETVRAEMEDRKTEMEDHPSETEEKVRDVIIVEKAEARTAEKDVRASVLRAREVQDHRVRDQKAAMAHVTAEVRCLVRDHRDQDSAVRTKAVTAEMAETAVIIIVRDRDHRAVIVRAPEEAMPEMFSYQR